MIAWLAPATRPIELPRRRARAARSAGTARRGWRPVLRAADGGLPPRHLSLVLARPAGAVVVARPAGSPAPAGVPPLAEPAARGCAPAASSTMSIGTSRRCIAACAAPRAAQPGHLDHRRDARAPTWTLHRTGYRPQRRDLARRTARRRRLWREARARVLRGIDVQPGARCVQGGPGGPGAPVPGRGHADDRLPAALGAPAEPRQPAAPARRVPRPARAGTRIGSGLRTRGFGGGSIAMRAGFMQNSRPLGQQ